MAGLLVPAVILGQQDAPPPPPPVLVYTADTPTSAAPAVLPELAAQPLIPPGQDTQTPPPTTVTTPAFPPEPPAPSMVPATPTAPVPEPAAPEPRPQVQPIATSGEAPVTTAAAFGTPPQGGIQQVGYVEGNPSAPAAPGVAPDSGLPFDPPTLGKPGPSPPTRVGTSSQPRGSRPTSGGRSRPTGLPMEPEEKVGGEHPPEGVAGSTSMGQGPSLVLETAAPPRILIGKPVRQRIVVRNIGSTDAAGVRVEEALQAGVRPGRSEPAAAVVGNRLSWDLGTVEAGGERRLQVDLEAAEPMTLELSPTLQFVGVQTHVVQPELSLSVEGPERVMRGEPVLFRLVASNNSARPLHQVRLHYDVPDGLHHSRGKRIGVTLEVLQAGEKRPIELTLESVQAGKWESGIVAEADNGIRAEVRHEIQVVEPVMTLQVSGQAQGLIEQEMVFRLEAGNPGPTPALQTRIVLIVPPGVLPVATQPAAQYDPVHRTLSWTVTALPVGEKQVVLVKVRAQKAGDWPLYAQVSADNRGPTRCGHALHVEVPPPLAVEIAAHKDALDMGEETVYVVHVLNLSGQTQRNVRLSARLSPTLEVGRVSGPVHGAGEQQQARFEVLPFLAPAQDAVYQIPVRGCRPGSGGLHVEVSTDGLHVPLVKEARVLVGNRGVPAKDRGTAR